jgi:predicted RND superfamily exporter protein
VLYDLGNFTAVIVFKLMLTAIAAILLYYIALNIPGLDRLCILTCPGASVVGVMASLSNLMGAFTGSTLWIFGIRGDMIAYILFTLFFIMGIADVIMRHNGYFPSKKTDEQSH